MMSLFSIPVVEKSGVSVACFKIIKLFFLIWLLLRFLPLVFTVTYQIITYLDDISISCIYPIGVYNLLESMAGLFISLGKFLAVISSNFASVSSPSCGIIIINWDSNSMHIRPFPSAPFFSSFWRRGQRHRRMCLARSPMVHGCSWWSPMNLRQVLPFIFNSYFCCFLNCGLTVLFIQHSKGVFVFFLTLF